MLKLVDGFIILSFLRYVEFAKSFSPLKLPNTSTRPLRDQNEQFITVNNLDDAIRNLIQQLAMKSQQNLELKKNYQASIAK